MDKLQLLVALSIALFAVGLLGVIIRRNVLVMLMCMELMLNGVIVSLVAFAQQAGSAAAHALWDAGMAQEPPQIKQWLLRVSSEITSQFML